MNKVRDNKALSRFELDVEGAVAFANYRLAAVERSSSPTPKRRAHCAAAASRRNWCKGALQLIRADGLKVVAGCGFVVDYLQKHPEFSDLVG